MLKPASTKSSLPELWRRAGGMDAVFLQKRVPSLTQLLLLRRRVPRLLFDFDDAIWLRRDDDGTVRPASLRKRLRLVMTLHFADAVVAGNQFLAAYARRWNPNVAVLPTPLLTPFCPIAQGKDGSKPRGSMLLHHRVEDKALLV